MVWAGTREVNENMAVCGAAPHTERKNRKKRYTEKEPGYIETFL